MADAVIRWKASARSTNPVTVLDTGLNSLTNNSGVLSSAVSNDAADELDLWMDLELAVTFGTNPTADSLVEIYVVRTVDGTNYETELSEGRPRNGFVGGFVCDNVTSAQRLIIPQVPAPPRDFKIYALNKSGQSFPASGSTIKAYFYSEVADEA